MKISRTQRLDLALVLGAFVVAAALYHWLPDPVPTHWNDRGEVDGFIAKPLGAFVLPLVMAGVYVLLSVLPKLSPRGFEIEKFIGVFHLMRTVILGFLFVIGVVALVAATGAPVPVGHIVIACVGMMFVVLGNYMTKVRKNFFIGIRTPWTLASDEVWLRTHRLAGKLLVLAGMFWLVCGLSGHLDVVALPVVGVALAIPAVYSYFLYRRIEGSRHAS